MSYKVTVYFNDVRITSTNIFGVNGAVNVTRNYGAETYSASDFTGTTTFTATAASGSTFTRWVYRYVDSSGTQSDRLFSTQNPFVFNERSDVSEIIIRAEGVPSTPNWVCYTHPTATIPSGSYAWLDISFEGLDLHRLAVVFTTSGTARFYTEGNQIDVVGYLSDNDSWDSADGVPTDYLSFDDDGRGVPNFEILYNVEANTPYYIWVRGISPTVTGDTTLYIDAPSNSWTLSGASLGEVTSKTSVTITMSPYLMCRRTVTFTRPGMAKFYTTGSVDTYGYISTSASWDSTTGVPLDYFAANNNGNGSGNFLITYNVKANTPYYVWVRGQYDTPTGNTTLTIFPPSDNWWFTSDSLGTVTSDTEITFTLGQLQMRRYEVKFMHSGTAGFIVSNANYPWCWLSTTPGFNEVDGEPTSWIAEPSTSTGDRVVLSYDVTAGVTYYIWVSDDGNGSTSVELYIHPPDSPLSIDKWSWNASNGSASASQTSAAYNAVVRKTAVTNFSYLVWNDLVDKVNDILDATGNAWDPYYTTYAKTKMSTHNKTLTAVKFNSLRYNISLHCVTGIEEVSKNDDVLGQYFTKLAECINTWIDKL